jgi:uncharacterized FlgJ-related protein
MEAHSICINPGCENYLGVTIAQNNLKWAKNSIILTAITICLLFTYDDFSMENSEELNSSVVKLPNIIPPANMESVQRELELQAVVCPQIVLAQVRIESGNFKSGLYRKTNNMIGMRYPFKRKTVASGIYIPLMDTVIYGTQKELKKYSRTQNYAVYSNWKNCIADYKLWQESNFNLSRHYLTFLGNVYAEDSLYVDKIKRISVKH